MNEQIKELWANAALDTAAYPSGQNNSWETQVNFIERFAELIVQECAELVDRAISEGGVDGSVVKEHFGVKDEV